MALTMGPNTGLVENGEPGEGHYAELMRKWRWEDFLAQPVVKSRVTALPTNGQANGDTYLYVGSGENANKLARWTTRTTTAQWEYLTAKLGWRVQVADQLDADNQVNTYEFDGSAWVLKVGGSGGGSGILDNVIIIEYTETINASAGATLDRSSGGIQRLNMAANTTLDLSDLSAGQSVMYRVTGGTTYTLSYTGLGAWSNGTTPTLSATHYLEFVHDGVEVVGFDCGGR